MVVDYEILRFVRLGHFKAVLSIFVSLSKQLYDLDGNLYNEVDVAQIYYDATIEFQKTHPKFMGAKIIYAPIRIVDDERFDHYIEVSKTLNVSETEKCSLNSNVD